MFLICALIADHGRTRQVEEMEGSNRSIVGCCRHTILSTTQHLRRSRGASETERERVRAKQGLHRPPLQGKKGATTDGRDQVAMHAVPS